MKKILILAVVLLIGFLQPGFAQDKTDITYQHTAEAQNITFAWTVDGDSLHVKLTAKTTAWVGIGFNPSEGMKDANLIIGYVRNGEVSVRDDFGSGLRNHSEDTRDGGQENVTNAFGKEENGTTEIGFTIPLNSGDAKDQAITPDGDTTVLLSYGGGRDSFLTKHRYHTILKVNLSTGKYEEVQ